MNKEKKKYDKKRNDGTPSRRKFLGFDFYIQCNEKLSSKNRETLLFKSENYLSSIYHSIPNSLDEKINKGISNELDRSLNDYELLNIWNPLYEKYGYLIPEFKEKWERSFLKGTKEVNKLSNSEMIESRFNELEFRIKQLELQNLKQRGLEGMG
jgi:hypothetical protein